MSAQGRFMIRNIGEHGFISFHPEAQGWAGVNYERRLNIKMSDLKFTVSDFV